MISINSPLLKAFDVAACLTECAVKSLVFTPVSVRVSFTHLARVSVLKDSYVVGCLIQTKIFLAIVSHVRCLFNIGEEY